MGQAPEIPNDELAWWETKGFQWSIPLLGLFVYQAWMVLGFFGFGALFDQRPILSGYHPQHLYLGTLGATALRTTGCSCCYDPAFQIGYPKTPIFNGSRMAESFLVLSGGGYEPAVYKMGLASLFAVVPIFLIIAARGAGLGWPGTFWATLAGIIVWWSPSSVDMQRGGTGELLIGSLAVLAHIGLLMRFHRQPGVLTWIGLVFMGAAGWFVQPTLFPIALPLLLVYYLNVGHCHSSLMWHFGLMLAEILTLVINANWLLDWITYWWLRSPTWVGGEILQHRTIETLWNAPLWGGPGFRALGLALLFSAAMGVMMVNRSKHRPAARVLGLGWLGMFVLAILGISWEPLGTLGTSALLAPALWFACLPAAHFWTAGFRYLSEALNSSWLASLPLFAIMGIAVLLAPHEFASVGESLLGPEPLEMGLGPRREMVVASLQDYTTPNGRILWEDLPQERTSSRWTPLLPVLTKRNFIGGLDSDVFIEHSTIGLVNQNLHGKPISTWRDSELDEYCQRYNIGWIVCWSPAAQKRFSEWPGAEKSLALLDQMPGWLFAVKNAKMNYALKGKAEIVHASSHHITLANVEPENGVVVLSLHFQAGMRANPGRVQVEREPCPNDPIGFVRLRLTGPASRITLTWGNGSL